MHSRYADSPAKPSLVRIRLFTALRERFREGYSAADFRSDLFAGIVVSMVAIPLGMALAIASGAAPQYGLYAVIIGGALVALLGGSRSQVTGPTAAFVVILLPVTQKFGFSGLLVAGFMAGIMLLLMGAARMGQLIQFIPNPVTTGFTSGIALVIASIQLKDFFGLNFEHAPEHFLERIEAMFHANTTWSSAEAVTGVTTLLLLLAWPRVRFLGLNRKIPAPLVALSVVTVATLIAQKLFPGFDVATIGSRFSYVIGGTTGHGIPQQLPRFNLPWRFEGAVRAFNLATIRALLPSSFAIAMLGAIESLLSAVVADGMARTKHDPDTELVALGIGNIVCPFFGGIPATGAIARTATNIRYGSRSPLAAVFHAAFTLIVVLLFAPYVSYLPMAALAALLLLVAYNMSEAKHFAHIVRVAPRSDVIVLLLCFTLTVIFDMVIGVSIGIVLAALLFMRRMSDLTSGQFHEPHLHPHVTPHLTEPLPKEVMLYEIAGPLFFGAAENAIEALRETSDSVRTVIFAMHDVPVMDMTGLVAFESALRLLSDQKREVLLVGIGKQPESLLRKSGYLHRAKHVYVFQSMSEAIHYVKREYRT